MPVFYCPTLKTNAMKQTAACGDGNTAGPGEDLLTFQGCWCQTISSKILPSVDMKQITQKWPHCPMWQGKVLALRDVASSVSRTGTSKRRVTNPAGSLRSLSCGASEQEWQAGPDPTWLILHLVKTRGFPCCSCRAHKCCPCACYLDRARRC